MPDRKELVMSEEFAGSRLFLNIPALVAHDKVLLKKSPKAILLFGEIYSMLNVTGSFYMSNNTIAKRLDCSRQSVINYIKLLKDRGYIESENVVDPETKAIKGRNITLGEVVKQNLLGGSNAFDGGSKTDLTQKEHNNKSSNTNDQSDSKKVSEKQLDEDFNKLWKLYPRKEGKKKAYEAYKRAIKKGVTNKEIQTGIVNYLTQIKIQGTDKKYVKQGSTWFNGNCWDDEYNVGGNSSPVNPNKTFSSAGRATRTSDDLEREERENQIEGFMRNYVSHPEWYTAEDVKEFLEDFPEMKERLIAIERARETSDRNTA